MELLELFFGKNNSNNFPAGPFSGERGPGGGPAEIKIIKNKKIIPIIPEIIVIMGIIEIILIIFRSWGVSPGRKNPGGAPAGKLLKLFF